MRMRLSKPPRPILTAIAAVAPVLACSSPAPLSKGPTSIEGSVNLLLAEVPGDVSCLRFQAEGPSRNVVKNIALAPGAQELSLLIPGVPPGEVTFTALAFPTACNAVAPQVVPSWVSDRVVRQITAGQTTPLTLALHRNGQLSVDFRFDDSSGGSQDCTSEGGRVVCGPCVGTCEETRSQRQQIDDYLTSLPAADTPRPRSEDIREDVSIVEEGGTSYACVARTKRIEDWFFEIPLLSAANSSMLPGLALQSRSIAGGTFNPLPLPRGGMTYSIDLPIADGAVEVPVVSQDTAQGAVATLIQRAQAATAPARIAYSAEIVASVEHAANALGVGIGWSGPISLQFGSAFGGSRSVKRRVLVAKLVQPIHTVSVSDDRIVRTSDFLAANATMDDIRALRQQELLGPDNLPSYVKSVTYGRALYFFVATEDAEDNASLAAMFAAAYKGFEANAELKATHGKLMSRAVVDVLAIGGSQEDGLAAVRSGDYSLFFKPVPVAAAVPIALKVNYMHRDRRTMAIRSALEYTVPNCTTCTRQKEMVVEDVYSAFYDEANIFGVRKDAYLGGACGPGWTRHDILKQEDGTGGCSIDWRSDSPDDCNVVVHISAPGGIDVHKRCRVTVRRAREREGQPPLCQTPTVTAPG